jgi:hypothetical protein
MWGVRAGPSAASESAVAGLRSRDSLETCHSEAAERQHVIAIALLDLQNLIDAAHGEDVGGQGVVDAANEAGHGLAFVDGESQLIRWRAYHSVTPRGDLARAMARSTSAASTLKSLASLSNSSRFALSVATRKKAPAAGTPAGATVGLHPPKDARFRTRRDGNYSSVVGDAGIADQAFPRGRRFTRPLRNMTPSPRSVVQMTCRRSGPAARPRGRV